MGSLTCQLGWDTQRPKAIHDDGCRSDSQVKVVFTGTLQNYEDICSLYAHCERLAHTQDPANLILQLYLQVGMPHALKLVKLCPHTQLTSELKIDGRIVPRCPHGLHAGPAHMRLGTRVMLQAHFRRSCNHAGVSGPVRRLERSAVLPAAVHGGASHRQCTKRTPQ